ncbi:MAG: ABC transporter permease [Bacteroidetes bacterium]|nr:MAG: ABC transporter permease [Bacteroidota bacterium]
MHFLFAWRYFKAKKSTNAINIIAWVSVIAITFATASLLILWSAFNGFEDLVKSLYATFYTDIKISPLTGKTIHLSADQFQKLYSISEIKSISRVAEEKALIRNGEISAIVELKGVDSNYGKVTTVENSLVRGKFDLGTASQPGAVMGVGVENAIGVLSDRSIGNITVNLPRRGAVDVNNPLSAFSEGQLSPSGSFAIQQEFDNKYILTNLEFVRQSMGFDPDEYSGIEISLTDPALANKVKDEIQTILGKAFTVLTLYEQNKSLYTVMSLEKLAIYVIFILVLAVAMFNLVGALTMLVMEKQKDIQVLQALGAPKLTIQKIFLSEGAILASIGLVSGMLIAFILVFAQTHFKLVPLEGTSFIIDYYPVKMKLTDFLVVIFTVLFIALLASWVPSMRAANQKFELRN